MSRQTIEKTQTGRKAVRAKKPAKSVQNTERRNREGRAASRRRVAKTRTAQLVALLSRKGGARLSLIMERLGWQAHTARAAISRLRKQGFDIATSKAPPSKTSKTPSGGGETVYAIVASSNTTDKSSSGAAQ